MKTKSFVGIIVLLVMFSTLTALPLVSVQAKATKIAVMGFGIPGPDPPFGTYRMWEPDGRLHLRNWTRDFTAVTWSDDYPLTGDPDPRLTGISREAYLSNQYVDEDGIAIGTLQSQVLLLPTAYDNGDGTYSGWWEGTGHGKTWHGEVNTGPPFFEMNFAFKTILQGQGEFKGMKLMLTVSVENALADPNGFEVQGYILNAREVPLPTP